MFKKALGGGIAFETEVMFLTYMWKILFLEGFYSL